MIPTEWGQCPQQSVPHMKAACITAHGGDGWHPLYTLPVELEPGRVILGGDIPSIETLQRLAQDHG